MVLKDCKVVLVRSDVACTNLTKLRQNAAMTWIDIWLVTLPLAAWHGLLDIEGLVMVIHSLEQHHETEMRKKFAM